MPKRKGDRRSVAPIKTVHLRFTQRATARARRPASLEKAVASGLRLRRPSTVVAALVEPPGSLISARLRGCFQDRSAAAGARRTLTVPAGVPRPTPLPNRPSRSGNWRHGDRDDPRPFSQTNPVGGKLGRKGQAVGHGFQRRYRTPSRRPADSALERNSAASTRPSTRQGDVHGDVAGRQSVEARFPLFLVVPAIRLQDGSRTIVEGVRLFHLPDWKRSVVKTMSGFRPTTGRGRSRPPPCPLVPRRRRTARSSPPRARRDQSVDNAGVPGLRQGAINDGRYRASGIRCRSSPRTPARRPGNIVRLISGRGSGQPTSRPSGPRSKHVLRVGRPREPEIAGRRHASASRWKSLRGPGPVGRLPEGKLARCSSTGQAAISSTRQGQ